jgi:hypothetical protein
MKPINWWPSLGWQAWAAMGAFVLIFVVIGMVGNASYNQRQEDLDRSAESIDGYMRCTDRVMRQIEVGIITTEAQVDDEMDWCARSNLP